MMAVDMDGAFYACRAVLPGMIHQKYGRILLVSSMWGQTGGSCEVAYSAAKAGLIGLGKALAKEEGPSGITVNVIAPGVIDTDMMAGFTAEDRAALAEETPVERLGNSGRDCTHDGLSGRWGQRLITGQVLGVNGGLVDLMRAEYREGERFHTLILQRKPFTTAISLTALSSTAHLKTASWTTVC